MLERIREHVGELYGYINIYEGRPTGYQTARADSLGRELEDVITDFKKLTEAVRARFAVQKTAKPASSRQISIEQYVIGKGFRGLAPGGTP